MGKTYQPVARYDNADYTTQDRGKLAVGDFNGGSKCDISTLNFYSGGSGTMVNFMWNQSKFRFEGNWRSSEVGIQ